MGKTVSLSVARAVMIGLGATALFAITAAVALPVPGKPAPTRVATTPQPKVGPVTPVPAAAYVIKTALTLSGPLKHGDWVWKPEAAPGNGPVLITVDLKAQMLSVFRDGHEIGVAVINYGAPEKPTPLGSFVITEKDAVHFSSIYDGAPMPHMLRLTNDGISIHGATVDGEWATNGCVGIPEPFAKLLFDAVELGDPVVITNGAMLKIGDTLTKA